MLKHVHTEPLLNALVTHAGGPCGHQIEIPCEAYGGVVRIPCETCQRVCGMEVLDVQGIYHLKWYEETVLPTITTNEAESLARRFHETYERLAPEYGYKTREASAVPWINVPSANKALMIAVAREILSNPQK